MSILNIFNGKKSQNSENNEEQIDIVNNKENILEFKERIANLAAEQKEVKKITRSPHIGYNKVWSKQNEERNNKECLFKFYTAYYIVKHYLWTDNTKIEEYINKVVNEAKHALNGNEEWYTKMIKERFIHDVNDLVMEYMPEEQDDPRLYVLISKDLNPVYGCVQGGHAVAQWLLEHDSGWRNNYLIYLYADIDKWIAKLDYLNVDYSLFKEPDLANKITAVAVKSDGKLFKKLQLVK